MVKKYIFARIADAVRLVVVAIPEGLPLVMTLTLAHLMKKMMADQVMVRLCCHHLY